MLVHRCGHPRCYEMIATNQRYCDQHRALHVRKPAKRDTSLKAQKKYNKFKRDPIANSFYHSRQWQQVRNFVFNRDLGSCQVCQTAVSNRYIVDHIIRRELCNNPLDVSNLWLLCSDCHHIKSDIEKAWLEKGGMYREKLRSVSRQNWKNVILNFKSLRAKKIRESMNK